MLDLNTNEILTKKSYQLAKRLIETCFKANSGHIGSCLSSLNLLVFLFHQKMNVNDEFILSKGHAAAIYYIILYSKGYISEEVLETFYKEGTLLAAHPPCSRKIEKIKFGTGSLGHGLSLSNGLALAQKIKQTDKKVFCLLSDGECNEGSVWEAAMFAAHHKLNNLYVVIDKNNLQGLGKTSDIIDMNNMEEKWDSFGFETVTCSGHDFNCINSAFLKVQDGNKPKCIIANTVKGNSVTFMENDYKWHYLPLTKDLFEQALKDIENYYAS